MSPVITFRFARLESGSSNSSSRASHSMGAQRAEALVPSSPKRTDLHSRGVRPASSRAANLRRLACALNLRRPIKFTPAKASISIECAAMSAFHAFPARPGCGFRRSSRAHLDPFVPSIASHRSRQRVWARARDQPRLAAMVANDGGRRGVGVGLFLRLRCKRAVRRAPRGRVDLLAAAVQLQRGAQMRHSGV